MAPSKRPRSLCFISSGSTRLFVGPASCRWMPHTKVRSFTRATSDGSERVRKLFGHFCGFSGMSVPPETKAAHNSSCSACDPSHQ
jgi:hypothetical protein